ncbi:alpha/beta fold hydrolase [Leifsonia poae]|uniref:alpha/beta fold hydrolase n=1 Tax=Leifsonia poae TaxID=110933 RepID=UPI001CBCF072|nr:alpha/beta hydrolase [Leifsonia poae]
MAEKRSAGTTATTTPGTAVSADGTIIAYEKSGSGPAVVLVDGALCYREFGPARSLAATIADRFTVYAYDRRGRGSSGDTAPYDVAREIDDLRAVIEAASAQTHATEIAVYGISSGAGLALEAAAAGVPMRALITYEAPYIAAGWKDQDVDHLAALRALLARGKRGAAVGYFMVRMVGAPAIAPLFMRAMPTVWKQLKGAAHTLPNDVRVMSGFRAPTDRLAGIAVPTLVLVGGKAAPAMREAQDEVAAAIPGARFGVLEGQTHQVADTVIGPRIVEFAG